jgi:YHS domain-containing protein
MVRLKGIHMVNMIRNLLGGAGKVVIDPVCGMEVNPKNPAGGDFVHEETRYFFCGKGCRLEFQEDPVGYLSGDKKMEM